MSKKLDQLVMQLENYVECWKQFSSFINVARAKKSGQDEESQFLELKSVITQELETLFAAVEFPSPTREDIYSLLGSASSIRAMGEMNEGQLRVLENQWHKIFIAWQSNLGQLKVKQREESSKGLFSSFFGKKK